MLKLYKKNGKDTLYWEAWERDEGGLIVHTGVLGNDGEVEEISLSGGEDAHAVITQEAEAIRADGYVEVSPQDHAHLILQYKMRGEWDGDGAVQKRHGLEDMVDQALGWTGNGHCDGGDIGSGTVNVFMFVVDAGVAKDTVLQLLKEEKQLDGAVLAVQTGDDGYEVLWPAGHKGVFGIV